jgi:hypothetical protein
MKKWLVRLFMVCIVAALVLWWSPELRRQAHGLLKNAGVRSPSITVYKWKDKHGVVQYTQALPPPDVPYEEVEARSDVNVLPLPEQLKQQ